jgi:hypothetical protein
LMAQDLAHSRCKDSAQDVESASRSKRDDHGDWP